MHLCIFNTYFYEEVSVSDIYAYLCADPLRMDRDELATIYRHNITDSVSLFHALDILIVYAFTFH